MSTNASLATVCPAAANTATRCADNWITSEKLGPPFHRVLSSTSTNCPEGSR
jgi:hypothetical protein